MRHSHTRSVVELRANGRCEYCYALQITCGYRFHVDDIKPKIKSGTEDETNLALACATCNLAKSDRNSGFDPSTGNVEILFNPRQHSWQDHFHWENDRQTIFGVTGVGRATVLTLDLNSEFRLKSRLYWIEIGLLP